MPMNPCLMRPIARRGGLDFDYDPANLTLVYDTSKEPENLQISVPLNGTVNCTIDWGDGSSESHTTSGFKTHTYAAAGIYTVQISGTLTRLDYGLEPPTERNKAKLTRCLSFGNVGLEALRWAFRSCRNLVYCPDVLPNTVVDMRGMFWGCRSFNHNINNWDTSAVTDMSSVFVYCDSFNQYIGDWNTSKVRSMTNMFLGCTAFNQDIGDWDFPLGTTLNGMFYDCISFNQDIGSWDVSKVRNMFALLYNCDAFSQDLGSWDLSGLNNAVSLDWLMLTATGLNTPDYDATLIGWNAGKAAYRNDLRPAFGGSKYTAGGAAAAARSALVSYGWTITDGGTA